MRTTIVYRDIGHHERITQNGSTAVRTVTGNGNRVCVIITSNDITRTKIRLGFVRHNRTILHLDLNVRIQGFVLGTHLNTSRLENGLSHRFLRVTITHTLQARCLAQRLEVRLDRFEGCVREARIARTAVHNGVSVVVNLACDFVCVCVCE